MTVTRCLALCTTVAAAGALLHASDRPLGSNATVPSVRLTTISAKVNGKGASLVIEASEPVSYVASRPDPLTLLLDFRNVGAEGVANSVAANAKSPIASVVIEAAESLGAPASRVRIALAQPVTHRVRSDRNTVVIDFERSSGKVPYVLPPATTSTGSTPDAMQALAQKESPASDPIEALGLKPGQAGAPLTATPARPLALSATRQAQPPVPPQPEIGTSRGGERKFTGHPVSLDFQGADLRAVLRTFSEISGLNIVIDPAVQGTVDVALAFVVAVGAFGIQGLGHGNVDKQAEQTTYRIYRRSLHAILVVGVVVILAGDRIKWANCATGFLWRTWLFLYILPWWLAAAGLQSPTA